MNPLHTYADGHPYRAPRSRFRGAEHPILHMPVQVALPLHSSPVGWAEFWAVIQGRLRTCDFQLGTLKVYRQVLRAFKAFLQARRIPAGRCGQVRPGDATREFAEAFIVDMAERSVSWSWQSTAISVLRTAFDKLGGLTLTVRLRTPKRPDRLGEIVGDEEVARMIAVCPTIRDRLLIGLLYGCGLKAGEACGLRWADIDVGSRTLTVRFDGGTRTRQLSLPEALLPVLAEGVRRCPPGAFVFAGGRPERPLSTRSAQRIVKRAAREAGLWKEVCCMSLRHGHAVSRLRAGESVRRVQMDLGHRHVATTMRYQRWLVPTRIVSPADRLAGAAGPARPASPPSLPPLSPEGLSVPFDHIAAGPREFRSGLKAQLTDCFLALRRFVRRPRGRSP